MRLLSIQVGPPRTLGNADSSAPEDRLWTTGFYKTPILGGMTLSCTGLAGDGQADLRNHGGPDKAVCVYPEDHWTFWEAELGRPPVAGAFGENFTTRGMVESDVCIGDVFRCGEAVLQVSQPRQPCWKLARRWGIKDLALQVERTGRTGWYFRVLQEGLLEGGEVLSLIERTEAQWTVAAANEVMHHRKNDWAAAKRLAECPALSVSWRTTLIQRACTKTVASPSLRQGT